MIVSPQAQPTGTRSGISWDEPACLLCGSDRRWPLVEAADTSAGGRGLRFVVVRCDDCGLCYTSPRPDRRRVLRAAYDLLAPGGRLMVAVPNIESAAFQWFGPAWFGLDLPRHLTHFTPPTLRAMFDAAGFRVARLRLIRHSDWLRSSA